jgi:hypothetical protein
MTKRRWDDLGDINTGQLVAASNLRGLSLDEAETRVREMIDAVQEEWLADYETMLIDIGADPADLAAVARLRAEHVRLREAAIERMRALVGRGGKGLN